jgi:hypothetical protein
VPVIGAVKVMKPTMNIHKALPPEQGCNTVNIACRKIHCCLLDNGLVGMSSLAEEVMRQNN